MPDCACGCGKPAKTGKYLQGHEQKLRKELKVTEMYAQGRVSLDGLGRLVKLIYQ
jgi:hypothetical protein